MDDPSITHVAIVGAGPYGLSLAAHLRENGVPFRIFGKPMQSWATQMPVGMKLKSDGFASNLYAAKSTFTLAEFCRETGRPYGDAAFPIGVEDFVAYGQEFQRRLVPSLDTRNVAGIEREGDAFRVTLEGGEMFAARRVVLATGLSLFQYIPEQLRDLPTGMVTHTTDHTTFEEFAGRHVTVLGRGASSLNAAALLHEGGVDVTVISRHRKIHVHSLDDPEERSVYQKLRHPSSPLGYSLRSWLSCAAPDAFRALPYPVRKVLTYKHLGPSGGTALQGRVEGKVSILSGWSVEKAEVVPGEKSARLRLSLRNAAGDVREQMTDHIIAGTGFRYELARLSFLATDVVAGIRAQPTGAPVLDRYFQSTAKGVYFIGPSASTSFGQLLRFAAGAGFAANRVTGHLLRDFQRMQQETGAVQTADVTRALDASSPYRT